MRLRPGFAGADNCLGVIRQRQNRPEEALACFQRAVKADANNWQAHLNLASVHLALGHREQAVAEFRETLRLEPGSQLAQRGLIAENRRRLLCLSMFWHFLDVVWIGVFTFVYLMGVLP